MFDMSFVVGRRQRSRKMVRTFVTLIAMILMTLTPGARVQFAEAQSLEGDLAIMSAAAALELQAIAAYQAGAESGLLSPPILAAAVSFLEDHQAHANALNSTLNALGAEAIRSHGRYDFGTLENQGDVLRLALQLEQGAADAYTALAANLQNKDVLVAAAGILVDEVSHATTLRLVLGLPVFD
jgi:hypothetical protein